MIRIIVFGFALVLLPGSAGSADSLPVWIWPSEDRHQPSEARVAFSFSSESPLESAQLRVTADFAALVVQFNGVPIAELEPYDPPLTIDLLRHLSADSNQLELISHGAPGPSAIAAEITLQRTDGEVVRYASEESWGDSMKSFGAVDSRRWAPHSLPEISPIAEYNQWREATADAKEQFSPLPPGFQIERLRTAEEGEDSWVSLAIDPEGRLIVAREKRGLLRMTLPNEGSSAKMEVEVIDDTLEECRGLAFQGNTLFANANRSLALYRLRDTTEDDQYDEITLLRSTEGKTGHGRNDLAIGPEGRVHAIHGDVVEVPADSQKLTVPESGAPKELGHWVSTSPDGAGWRLHNRGLRNPYGIDFNNDGEPFTYDADNEGDVGLPFYRPTRINHLVSGANYGWHQDRGNSRNLTVWAPDSVPTTFDVGRGSPTGVKFGYGSNFPPPYQEALFALDWAYGRIIAVHLVPRGASYYGSGELFLEGRPLNVTDLDFTENGDMLFITGGRKTQSALYRIRYTGQPVESPATGPQALAREAFSKEARQRRVEIERYHGNPDPPDFEAAWKALGDADPWIRNAARVAVETQAGERWRKRALSSGSDLHGLMALLALARAGTVESDLSAISSRIAALDFDPSWGRDERLTVLRTLEICLGRETHALPDSLPDRILPWLGSNSDPVRRETLRFLVLAGHPEAISSGLRLAAEAGDQLERLHYLEMLGDAAIGWSPELREAYVRDLVHAKNLSFGDRFLPGFFQAVEANTLSHIPDREERESLAARFQEELEPLPQISPREPVKQWTLADFTEAELTGPLANRDRDRGRRMYDAALCSRCHVAGNHGRPVGPDLTTISRRFSRSDLLEAIIEPSKVVAEVHRNLLIERNDGSVIQGRVVQDDFRKSLLYIAQDPFAPTDLTEVPKTDIATSQESPISPMPPALLDTLTREEILDLLAWLEAGGQDDEK